jgi:hypothetical protein
MKTLIANIRYAIRNGESVTIGGGEFSPYELQKIVQLYEAANLAREALTWLHGGEPLPTMEAEALAKLKEITP